MLNLAIRQIWEDELDKISNGEIKWKNFLSKFWKDFYKNTSQIMDKPFAEVIDALNHKIASRIFGFDENGQLKDECPTCKTGKLGLRLGKFGAFIGCSNYPTCKHTMQILVKKSLWRSKNTAQFEPRNLGKDSTTGFEVIVKIGPYGPYLELEGSEVKARSCRWEKIKAKSQNELQFQNN